MPEKKLEKKLYEFSHLFKPDAYRSETLAEGVQSNLDELQKFYDKAMARIAVIRRNAGLTLKGKADAFAKLKDELTKELQEWAGRKKGYAAEIKQIEAAAQPTRHQRDDAAHESRAREIRDHLRSLDPAAAEAEFLAAAEAGNSELLQAVLYSPIKFHFATADLVAKVSRQQWERERPDDAARLADLRRAQSEVQSALGSVKADMGKQGLELRVEHLGSAAAA